MAFSDFQYRFRFSQSTADLLSVVSDRIAWAFKRSWATQAVAQIFDLISSFLSNRQLWVVLDGKSSQEYPVNVGVLKAAFLGLHLPDDVICNIAIYADDTTP